MGRCPLDTPKGVSYAVTSAQASHRLRGNIYAVCWTAYHQGKYLKRPLDIERNGAPVSGSNGGDNATCPR